MRRWRWAQVKLRPAQINIEQPPLDSLGLLPKIPWDSEFTQHWRPDLEGARAALTEFADTGVRGYQDRRDRPALPATSRLSPYLASGQLGPRQVWAALHASGAAESNDGFKFLSEIAWREFAYHLLYHFPAHAPAAH